MCVQRGAAKASPTACPRHYSCGRGMCVCVRPKAAKGEFVCSIRLTLGSRRTRGTHHCDFFFCAPPLRRSPSVESACTLIFAWLCSAMPMTPAFFPVSRNPGSQFFLNHSIVSGHPTLYGMIGLYPRSFSIAVMSNQRCIVSTKTLNTLSLKVVPSTHPTSSHTSARAYSSGNGSLNLLQSDVNPMATTAWSSSFQKMQYASGSGWVSPSVAM
mmetsp:Transcript_19609/g.60865  ORF Transcript_19609/g.60865 Transcript_19609/m.60865 type:complete len:213 (-) Transcript_19609:836-1474(-)